MVPQHHVRARAAVCATQSPWPSTIRACDSPAKFTTRFHPLTPARSLIGILGRQATVADPPRTFDRRDRPWCSSSGMRRMLCRDEGNRGCFSSRACTCVALWSWSCRRWPVCRGNCPGCGRPSWGSARIPWHAGAAEHADAMCRCPHARGEGERMTCRYAAELSQTNRERVWHRFLALLHSS
jgi:hypothetical protein